MFGIHKKKSEKTPLQLYTELILWQAIYSGADKICFGEPCDGLPRKSLADEALSDPRFGDCMKAFDELGPKMTQVPTWLRYNSVWHEMAGPSWYWLHEIVRIIADMIVHHMPPGQQYDSSTSLESSVTLESKRGVMKAVLSLKLEPNYCYSVTLKKVE